MYMYTITSSLQTCIPRNRPFISIPLDTSARETLLTIMNPSTKDNNSSNSKNSYLQNTKVKHELSNRKSLIDNRSVNRNARGTALRFQNKGNKHRDKPDDNSSDDERNVDEKNTSRDNEWKNVTNQDVIPEKIQFRSGSRNPGSQLNPNYTEPIDYFNSLFTDELIKNVDRQCSRRIYSNSETSEVSQDQENNSDTEESLNNFHEVTVTNDRQYNQRPLFLETTGPKHMPPNNSKPIDYLNLSFIHEFLDKLKIETNRYAIFFTNSKVPDGSRTVDWKKTTIPELRAFIAVLEMEITFFSCGQHLTSTVYSHEYDPATKFEPVVAHANKKFKLYYSPSQHLSIDSLVGTKSRSADQRDKVEIKEKDLAHVVIHKLLNMGNYFMKGYHIVADNFFTNITLARFLFEKHTFLTGTIRSNRKYIAPHLKQKLQVGEYKYFRNREILLLAYREKKITEKKMYRRLRYDALRLFGREKNFEILEKSCFFHFFTNGFECTYLVPNEYRRENYDSTGIHKQ
ncbi:unnamed protein product [Heterotrigona itama]|uniref:PiggyBac transposable element-derived protein domain-containing protein n=1 Tax=Heterotrigona itama TaxID=395501 RepID=A0A6V7HAI7_9HYME|nr:unnamed protein product [Heterotrigona itama]